MHHTIIYITYDVLSRKNVSENEFFIAIFKIGFLAIISPNDIMTKN